MDIGKIDNEVLYKYGLYISRVAGKILNIKTTLISKMYNKLPIKSREDIDIKSSDIVDLYGEGKEQSDFNIVVKCFKPIKEISLTENLKYDLMNELNTMISDIERLKK